MHAAAILGQADRLVRFDGFSAAQACDNAYFFGLEFLGNQPQHALADYLDGAKTKQSLRAGVPACDGPFEVFAQDCIFGGLDNCGQCGANVVGLFALDKLAKLIANAFEDLQEVLVRLADFGAEAIDDADDLFSELDRKAHCGAQPFGFGGIGALKLGILADVRNPNRGAVRPDPPRQAGRSETALARGGGKARKGFRWMLPDLDAGQFIGRFVSLPNRADLPASQFSEGLQNSWRGLGERTRFGQSAADRSARFG